MVFLSLFHKRIWLRNAFLFFVSLFFYYKTSGLFISILLFSTLCDYTLGLSIYKMQKKSWKMLLTALSIVINLFVLAYFKYAYFFTDSYNALFSTKIEIFNHFAHWSNIASGSQYQVNSILLPVGISFFTFQTISYSIDVYRERINPVRNIMDFGFYVSFFPQLVAGPIVRANEFIPQLYKPYDLDKKAFGLAVFMILNGMVKKLVLGDYIAVNFIDRVFDNPLFFTGFENLLALFGYSLQVYADFSGYTDMAIGIALLMGFRLPKNFNSPYKAKNLGEFWQRWHISLSTWLKDYLYIPLGGNRKASAFTWICCISILSIVLLLSDDIWLRISIASFAGVFGLMMLLVLSFRKWMVTNINLMLTMLLGGLWHGASFQFIIWGALNGIGLVVYKNWKKISPWENSTRWFANAWKIGLTFIFITFTRIWFRSETMNTSFDILNQIWNNFRPDLILEILGSYKTVFVIMLSGFVIHWLPGNFKEGYKNFFSSIPWYAQAGISTLIIFLVYQSLSAKLQPFIYFQF
ncbi:MAG: MBOAT family protein [Bacteroidetes bacterium]|nr:MBOAT family protein [Bacteroidota bacterium]HET6243283.1 MBOAT family O-acyltransferase [Bacteroidia bacterium]